MLPWLIAAFFVLMALGAVAIVCAVLADRAGDAAWQQIDAQCRDGDTLTSLVAYDHDRPDLLKRRTGRHRKPPLPRDAL